MKRDACLSHKQSLFVERYIQTGGNGTAAAREAGYKGNAATLGAVAHENLNKPHVWDEIKHRQNEIRKGLEISTQDKRMKLWEIARRCGKFEEDTRSVKVETMPDGSVVKTINILCSEFDPRNAIKAIVELNRMDGDYADPKANFRCLGCPYS